MGSEVAVWKVTRVPSGAVGGGGGVISASSWWSYFRWVSEVVGRSGVDARVRRALSVGGLAGADVATCTKLQGGFWAQ